MKNSIYILFVFVLGVWPLKAQNFIEAGGQATDIAMSPKDGSVYVVNASRNIKKYNSRTKKFHAYGAQSKNAKAVSVTKDGVVYMVSTAGEVHVDVNGKWIKVPGIKTAEMIASKDGNIYAIDGNKKLRHLRSGKWIELIGQNRNSNGLNQVLGIGPKELYARDDTNAFRRFYGGKWTTLNGRPNQIALDHKTEVIYAVGRNKGIYKWEARPQKWVLLPGTRKDFRAVAVNNGKIWGVTTNRGIYYYNATKNSNSEKDYAGKYRVTFGKILKFDPVRITNTHDDFYGVVGVRLNAKLNNRSITINPLDGKPFRVLDIPKSDPANYRKLPRTIPAKNFIYVSEEGKRNNPYGSNKAYSYYYDIDTVREFVLEDGTANNKAVFNFQFNLTRINHLWQHQGKWEQLNLSIDHVVFGKEYYFHSEYSKENKGFNSGICFKIEKL